MIDVRDDIDVETEAEETRYVPGARVVKALDFHSNIAGSSPVGDTKKGNMWCNDFKIKRFDTVIAGVPHSRLSVLQ